MTSSTGDHCASASSDEVAHRATHLTTSSHSRRTRPGQRHRERRGFFAARCSSLLHGAEQSTTLATALATTLSTSMATALVTVLFTVVPADASAQGRTITTFPYAQHFTFIPSGSSTTPSGPVGAPIFPTTDVDGGEFTVDSTTSSLMASGSSTGLGNNVGAGGMIRIQTSGSTLPTIAQGFTVHASFTGRTGDSIAVAWTKVSNGTSTRASELRIAASADGGPFSDITSVAFDNSATAQSGTLSSALPAGLDGAASVRFRIYAINVGGSGAHPRVIVDDLRIAADEETALPVELDDFEAVYHDGIVGLAWRTASEHDNEGFEVLRASGVDSVFAPVASYRTNDELRGLGTSPFGRDYRFDDALPASLLVAGTTLLYRLADVAPDGQRTEHPIRTVRIGAAPSPVPGLAVVRMRLDELRPLPAREHVVARFSLAAEELVTFEVIGMRGDRLVRTAPQALGAGTHEHALDVGGLAAGIYTLTARAGDAVRVRRFVITR